MALTKFPPDSDIQAKYATGTLYLPAGQFLIVARRLSLVDRERITALGDATIRLV